MSATTAESIADDLYVALVREKGGPFTEREIHPIFNTTEGPNALEKYLEEVRMPLSQVLHRFPDKFISVGNGRWAAASSADFDTCLSAMGTKKQTKRGGRGTRGRGYGSGSGINNPRIAHSTQSFKHSTGFMQQHGRNNGMQFNSTGTHGSAFRPGNHNPEPSTRYNRPRSPRRSPPPGRQNFAPRPNSPLRQNFAPRPNSPLRQNFAPRPNSPLRQNFAPRPNSPLRQNFAPRPNSPLRQNSERRQNYSHPHSSSSRRLIDEGDYDCNRGYFEESVYDQDPSYYQRPQDDHMSSRNQRQSPAPLRSDDYSDFNRGSQRSVNSTFQRAPETSTSYDRRNEEPLHKSVSRSSIASDFSRPDSSDTSFNSIPSLAPPPGLPIPKNLKQNNADAMAKLAQRFKGVQLPDGSGPSTTPLSDSNLVVDEKTEKLAKRVKKALKTMNVPAMFIVDFFSSVEGQMKGRVFPGGILSGKIDYLEKLKATYPELLARMRVDREKNLIIRVDTVESSEHRVVDSQQDSLLEEVRSYVETQDLPHFYVTQITQEISRFISLPYEDIERTLHFVMNRKFAEKYEYDDIENKYFKPRPKEGQPAQYHSKHVRPTIVGLEKVEITGFRNFGKFSVRLASGMYAYEEMNRELQEFMRENKPKFFSMDAWKKDYGCVLKSQDNPDQWVRGIVVKPDKQMILVYCLDFGITRMVYPEELSPMPVKLLFISPFAVPCFLAEEGDDYDELEINVKSWTNSFKNNRSAPYFIERLARKEKQENTADTTMYGVNLYVSCLGKPRNILEMQSP